MKRSTQKNKEIEKKQETEKIRAGIIGLGKMGLLHLGILNTLPTVEVVAITEKQTLLVNAVKDFLSISSYKDYRKMLDNEKLDVVYITTPVATHFEIAKEVIKKGVNLFIEKPLTINYKESLELLKLAKQNPIISFVGYCNRFVPTYREAKNIIDSGALGNLIYLKSTMYISQLLQEGRGWRYKKKLSGGGVLIGITSHLIDMLLWLFGDIKSVHGGLQSFYSKEVEDFSHAFLEFETGLKGFLDSSWSMRNHRILEMKIEVQGENGILTVTNENLKFYLDKSHGKYVAGWTSYRTQDFKQGVVIDLGGPMYTLENQHFIDSVKNKKRTEVDIIAGAKVQRIIDAIYLSSMTGRRIFIKEVS